MYPSEKNPRIEKLKALRAQASNELDHLLNQLMERENQFPKAEYLVRNLIILIDLLDALIEPEEPE